MADGSMRGAARAEVCPSASEGHAKKSSSERAIHRGARRRREAGVRLCVPKERRPGFVV